MVLGPEYIIEYVPTETGYSEEKYAELRKSEKKTIEVMMSIMQNVKPGDTAHVKEILFTKHPGYAKDSKVTFEMLKQSLGRGMRE
jgi:hypothetical protein